MWNKAKKNQECTDGGTEEDLTGCFAPTDNKAYLPYGPYKQQAAKGKRKAFDSYSLSTLGRAKRNLKTWSMQPVEVLIGCLKNFKMKCYFNGIDFKANLDLMHTKINRYLAVDFTEEFDPGAVTEQVKPL